MSIILKSRGIDEAKHNILKILTQSSFSLRSEMCEF